MMASLVLMRIAAALPFALRWNSREFSTSTSACRERSQDVFPFRQAM
jgi:hypothetical protein